MPHRRLDRELKRVQRGRSNGGGGSRRCGARTGYTTLPSEVEMMRFLALCLVLVTGCARSEPEVEFVATRLTEPEWQTWSRPGVESAHRHVTVRRTFRTPSYCRHLDADVVRAGHELVLRVTSEPSGEECPPGAGLWGYMALIRNLQPGRYQLRVVHTRSADNQPPETVLRHQVVVE